MRRPFHSTAFSRRGADLLDHAEKLDPDVVLETLHAMRCERRLILSLFYFEHLGHAEIGQSPDIPPGMTFARLAEAKTAFRQRLQQQSLLP